MTFRALGNPDATPNRDLETFATPHNISAIELDYDEFTSLCGQTGQPDYATVKIIMLPNVLCLESKSLKLYFQTFRNQTLFAEDAAAQICDDLFRATQPEHITVTVIQKRRGGIQITATARKTAEESME